MTMLDVVLASIITPLITGGLTLIGVILTNRSNHEKTQETLNTNLKVMDVKLENLTEEVRKHNNFAVRVPMIEKDVEFLKHEMEEVKKA